MTPMLTAEQLALWADNSVAKGDVAFSTREEKLFLMLDLIEKKVYHLVSPDIKEACRKQVGL
jgi:hypothetical protein